MNTVENTPSTFQLPVVLSRNAAEVDWLYNFTFWMSVVLFVAIIGTALYFTWKYRRRPGVKAEPTGHNTVMEVTWTVTPLILLIVLFHWGFQGYVANAVAPAGAMEIRIQGNKWFWDITYPNGAHKTNELHVPVNRAVKLVISASDVLHSFYLPGLRIKRDAVPGYYSSEWFEAIHTGTFDLFCAEYCGTGHSSMIGHLIVQTQAEYDDFLEHAFAKPPELTEVQWGERLYREQACATCHSLDGAAGQGPTWKGLFGRHETFVDGGSVTVDENYIRESILQPQAHIVRGYQPIMPTFQGSLRDIQIQAIIAFIKSPQLR